MGEDLPVRFFCAPSKRAQRYYLKLSIKGQHPNNRFRRLLCAFNWAHRLYIQADGVGVDQTFCLFLGVPPNYSLNRSWLGLWEKQQYVCFFYLWDLSQMKDVTMTGPLWLVNRSYPEDIAWNRVTSCCGLPPISFTVLNGGHSEEWDLIYSPR